MLGERCEAVAASLQATPMQVALAWLLLSSSGTNTLGTHPGQEASLQADECAALPRDRSLLIEEAARGAVVGKSGELDDDLGALLRAARVHEAAEGALYKALVGCVAAYPLLRNLPQFAPLSYIRPCTWQRRNSPCYRSRTPSSSKCPLICFRQSVSHASIG